MSRAGGVLLAALLAGCGHLPTTDDGVAYLEIIPPSTTTIPVGGTLQMTARALDQAGDPVETTIEWRTPDTTIEVDQDGLVTGLAVGTGRVQAAIPGSDRLVSNFIDLTVTAAPAPASGR